jgi:hypothetical protein
MAFTCFDNPNSSQERIKRMAEEKQEQAQVKPKRGKKINKMSVAEVEKALEGAKSSQGGQASRYARELVRRRDILKAGKK